jgi:F-type H+-transporting ATPase subunit epsilon
VADELYLTVLSPERTLVTNVKVTEVTLPGSEGQVQVLPGHGLMMGALETGLLSYKSTDGQVSSGAISTGFFRVTQNNLTVLAETLELSDEIDLARAKRAEERAQKVLEEGGLEDLEYKRNELKLQRALIRQQAAMK